MPLPETCCRRTKWQQECAEASHDGWGGNVDEGKAAGRQLGLGAGSWMLGRSCGGRTLQRGRPWWAAAAGVGAGS
ncbi:hypothetical protein E2562_007128 [Oryza meyeriana var. granulata]|uniref:Uncharacterized protein n=1 Tax=Oryza meyeriana var. granulata TaxID=110450 RepID=A0A6G1F4W3_9ORYZ|nr:hypothetical protein E2562_007128 [Oryza meyeriana var. granulata]